MFSDLRHAREAITRIEEILNTGVLYHAKPHPLQESAFIEIMIRLHDLLQQANAMGHRIAFTEDLHLFPHFISDITDAVREYRDAVCHVHANGHFIMADGSPKRRGQPARNIAAEVRFNMAFGKGRFFKIANHIFESDYDDEVSFFYGAHRLYMRRHIIRALDEVRAVLFPTSNEDTLVG